MAFYWESIASTQQDGAALTNTTTATSILHATGKPTFAANFWRVIGQKLRLIANGRISTLVTTPGTLTLSIRFGAVIVATGSAMVLSTTAKTNVSWYLAWDLTLRAVGSGTAANFMHTGFWTSEAAGATTVAGEAKTIIQPTSAPAVGTGFDSTAAQQVDLFAAWSVANAANSILVHQAEWMAAT